MSDEPTVEPTAESTTPTPAPEPAPAQPAPQPEPQPAPTEYNITVPEGMELDSALVEEFKPIAQELKLDQEKAQKLANLQIKAEQRRTKASEDAWDKQLADWVEAAKTDKEFGGEKFDDNVATARKALDEFGSDELKEFMDTSGAGNHPEVIRFLFKVGQAIGDDTFHKGNNTSDTPNDPAKILFPDMA